MKMLENSRLVVITLNNLLFNEVKTLQSGRCNNFYDTKFLYKF